MRFRKGATLLPCKNSWTGEDSFVKLNRSGNCPPFFSRKIDQSWELAKIEPTWIQELYKHVNFSKKLFWLLYQVNLLFSCVLCSSLSSFLLDRGSLARAVGEGWGKKEGTWEGWKETKGETFPFPGLPTHFLSPVTSIWIASSCHHLRQHKRSLFGREKLLVNNPFQVQFL